MAQIHEQLKAWSTKSLFDAKGDELMSAKKYYVNGLDGLLTAITNAARADGIDQQSLMKLFLLHAEANSNG
jgi:hypothetical protein